MASLLRLFCAVVVSTCAEGTSKTPQLRGAADVMQIESDLGLQTVDPTDWLRQCVPPFKRNNFSTPFNTDWSNFWNIEMPSGLCSVALTCAFKACEKWTPAANGSLIDMDLNTVSYDTMSSALPELNLPAKMSFPTSVRSLVGIVKFASSQNMSISIKNGGASYSGSSNQKGSIQLNLRSLPKYSSHSIVLCTTLSSDDACRLARDRKKPAKIRVGGGELFDNYYRAVIDWNTREGIPVHKKRLVAIGGGVGTIGASGGWLQGGGLSIGLDRIFGLGVDQVLALEMVLPDGTHVKFGPTQWTTGTIFPQTRTVKGHCNRNVVLEESKWVWEDCKAVVPWEDLWFAVRGGGGGTWGVVTAVHYQLHDAANVTWFKPNLEIALKLAAVNESLTQAILIDFFIDALFAPGEVNISEETSNNCGNTGYSLALAGGGAASGLLCNGGHGDKLLDAWKKYVTEILAYKYPSFVVQVGIDNLKSVFLTELIYSYVNQHMVENIQNPYRTRSPVGRVPDLEGGGPTIWSPYLGLWNAAMPIDWLLSKSKGVYEYLSMAPPSLHTQGGVSRYSSDGMDAVPMQVRQSGFVGPVWGSLITPLRNAMRPFMPVQPGQAYPPDTEFNHMAPDAVGPLKTNFSAPCPSGFTRQEQRDNCVGWADTIWAVEQHVRLQNIKRQLDPKNMFNCYHCIGYKDKEM